MIMQRQSQSQVKTIPNLPIVTISNSIIILDHLQEHAGRVPFYGGRGPAEPLAPVAPHQPDAQAGVYILVVGPPQGGGGPKTAEKWGFGGPSNSTGPKNFFFNQIKRF
jgi:hypothetical protein